MKIVMLLTREDLKSRNATFGIASLGKKARNLEPSADVVGIVDGDAVQVIKNRYGACERMSMNAFIDRIVSA